MNVMLWQALTLLSLLMLLLIAVRAFWRASMSIDAIRTDTARIKRLFSDLIGDLSTDRYDRRHARETVDARAMASARAAAFARPHSWMCPKCAYQISVSGDADLVIHQWSIGKWTYWRAVIYSHGVTTEVHAVGDGDCTPAGRP